MRTLEQTHKNTSFPPLEWVCDPIVMICTVNCLNNPKPINLGFSPTVVGVRSACLLLLNWSGKDNIPLSNEGILSIFFFICWRSGFLFHKLPSFHGLKK